MLSKLLALTRKINIPWIQAISWNYQYRTHESEPNPCQVCVRLLLEHVPNGGTIVELGCGGGYLAQELFRRGWDGSYIGLDLSSEAVTRAKRRVPQGLWLVGNMTAELGRVPNALVMVDSIYYLSAEKARSLIKSSDAPVTIVRIFDPVSTKEHSDMLRQIGFTEHKAEGPAGVFCHLNYARGCPNRLLSV